MLALKNHKPARGTAEGELVSIDLARKTLSKVHITEDNEMGEWTFSSWLDDATKPDVKFNQFEPSVAKWIKNLPACKSVQPELKPGGSILKVLDSLNEHYTGWATYFKCEMFASGIHLEPFNLNSINYHLWGDETEWWLVHAPIADFVNFIKNTFDQNILSSPFAFMPTDE